MGCAAQEVLTWVVAQMMVELDIVGECTMACENAAGIRQVVARDLHDPVH
jgi:hypothetical protein